MTVLQTYFFLVLDVDKGGDGRRVPAAASLRGLPRGRLSAWAGLPVDVAPPLLDVGEGPWSEGSTVLSSDDILNRSGKDKQTVCVLPRGTNWRTEELELQNSHLSVLG